METSQNPVDSASWGLKVADLMDSILRIGPTLSLQVSFISRMPSTWTILSWHRLLLSSTLLREVLTRLESAGLSDKLEKWKFSLPLFIHVDVCDVGLGAALMQRDDNSRYVVVAYASRALDKSERTYSSPEKECLAVIWALEHFRPYIEGLHVTIFSDDSSLRWIMSRLNLSGRLARCSLRLQDFDFDIVHKPRTSKSARCSFS